MMVNKKNRLDKIIEKLKNIKFVVFILILFSLITFLPNLTSAFKEILEDFSSKPNTEIKITEDDIIYKKFNIIVLNANNNKNRNEKFLEQLKRKMINSDIKYLSNWKEERLYENSKILFNEIDNREVCVKISKFFKQYELDKYYENQPFYGLSKYDIIIFIGKNE